MKQVIDSMDAKRWAEEFIRAKIENEWSLDDIDESLMLGWFANAIMAGYDEGRIKEQVVVD